MTVRELTAAPNTAALYSRAVLGALAGKKGSALPALTLVRRNVQIDRAHLATYNRVCGFSQRETLPATYPFVLAFPLHMEIITAPDFPFAAMGLVHIQNRITQHRPVAASETLTLTVSPANLRPHDKGLQFDILTTLTSGDEVVWEAVSTMLRRQAGSGGDSTAKASAPKAASAPAGKAWCSGPCPATPAAAMVPPPATATRSTCMPSLPSCSASRARLPTACGPRHAAWPRSTAACPMPSWWMCSSSCRCCCRPRSPSSPTAITDCP